VILAQVVLSFIALVIVIKLLYQKNIPLFLLAGVFMQWLSVSIKVFYGAINGVSLSDVFSYYYSPKHIDTAFFLSIVGVVAYTVGLKVSLPSYYKKWNLDLVKVQLLNADSNKIITFYLAYSIIFGMLWGFRFAIPGINTSLLALGLIKWGVLVIAVLSVYYKREDIWILTIILSVEIIMSLASYFSEFKEYFYFLIILFASLEKRFSFGRILRYSLIGFLLFQVAIIWTTVKGEYRTYLSKGERVQKVLVDQSLALSKLYDLASNYGSNRKELDQATAHLVDRTGYISFFSICLAYVPDKRPYENGNVWLEAFSLNLNPRLITPDKPVLDD